MKIGCFSESPADQVALAIFAEAILGEKPELIDRKLQAHGITGVFRSLDAVIRGVHYNSDAEGLIVVVDCDDTVLHAASHDTDEAAGKDCRFCQIRKIVARTRSQLKAVATKSKLKIAIGLAVPSIEAWYLVGKNHEVGEAAWIVGCAAKKPPFTRPQLKKLVYGTERPSIELEAECAERESRRIVANLEAIQAAFPIGFGLMAEELRSWKPKA